MLTEVGLKKVKKAVILLGKPLDKELNAILQKAVDAINVLLNARYPKSKG